MIEQIKRKKLIEILDAALFAKVIFLMLINNFPYIGGIATFIMQIISVIWAPFIIIRNLKYIRGIVKENFYWLLLLTAFSYGITVLINYKYNLTQTSHLTVCQNY